MKVAVVSALVLAALVALVAADYFSEIAKREGSHTTKSGIVYFIKKAGHGKQKPVRGQPVALHYKAYKMNGKEVDNSYKRGRPARLLIDDAIIPGWQEIIPMMVVGDEWEVHVPFVHAFGEKGLSNSIGPYENVIYDMELVDLKSDWKPAEPAAPAALPAEQPSEL